MTDWRLSIPIGSRVVIDDKEEQHIFYGYNYDRTIVSCFPVNSASITENMIFIPIKAILSISQPGNLEKQFQKLDI